jgi:hypothetical protein
MFHQKWFHLFILIVWTCAVQSQHIEILNSSFEGQPADAKFSDDAKLKETSTGLGSALGQVGHELKEGYKRIRDALKD